MPIKIVKKNKWARIVSHGKKGYVTEGHGPYGWIAQSDYITRKKAEDVYKKLSERQKPAVPKRSRYGVTDAMGNVLDFWAGM